MASAAKFLLLLIQLTAFCIYFYSIYYRKLNPVPPLKGMHPNYQFFGEFKYMTYWGLLLQFAFFTLLLVNNILKIKILFQLIDFIFYSLAFPVALLVTVFFWTMYAIDRELMFPRRLEPYYPPWWIHFTHTLILVFALIQLFWGQHKPPTLRNGLIMLNLFIFIYTFWSLYMALMYGIWAYPFLELMSWPGRIAFILSFTLVNYVLFKVGVWGYNLFGSKSQDSRKKIR